MGSRTWFKLFSSRWLCGTSRQDPIEVRGAFIDLLAMANSGLYGDDGLIQLPGGVGLTDQQIASIMNVDLNLWLRAKERLISTNRLEIGEGNIIKIVNWRKYQSEYSRQREYRKLQPKVTTESYNPKLQGEGEKKENRRRIEGEREGDIKHIDIRGKISSLTVESPEEFLSLYHQFCPNLPRVLKITPDRKKKIVQRIREHPETNYWAKVFTMADRILIPASKGHPEWRPDIDFIIRNESNSFRILEGKYPTNFQRHRQPAIEALLREEINHEAQ